MSPGRVFADDTSSAFTARTWIVLAGTVAALLVVGVALLATLSQQSRTSPGAPDVAEQFVAAAVTGDDDEWHPLLSPAFAERFDRVGGTPLIGDSAVLESLSVTYTVDSAHYMRAQSGEETDEQHADTAIVPVQMVFEPGSADGRIELGVDLVLTRPFAYDEAGRELENARADGTPTAIGPWRVSAIVAGESTRTTLPIPDAAGCETIADVLVDLSDLARIDGTVSDACLLEGDGLEQVLGADVDGAELAAELPVLSPARLPAELTGLPATAGVTLHVHRIDTASAALVAVVVQVGGGAEQDSRAALLALRPTAGAP